MATHSSVLAWRIPGMGSYRVGHDWSDLAAAAARVEKVGSYLFADTGLQLTAMCDTSPCMCVDVCVLCSNGAQAYLHVGVSTGYIRTAQKVGDRGWRREGDVLGSAVIIEVRVDSRGPGSVWRLHLVFGGRGPGLTFGLHGVRTVLIQRVNGPSQHRWEQSTVRRWQYRLAKPESRGGVRWEDGPGWGGEERGSLLLTPASLVQLPSLESLLLQTDAKLHFSLFPGSVMCLPATRH